MTEGENGENGEKPKEEAERSIPNDAEGSRFEDLFERLDEHRSSPDQSEQPASEEVQPDTPDTSTSESDREAEGWVWGSPKDTPEEKIETGETGTHGTDSSKASDRDRIWELDATEPLGDVVEDVEQDAQEDREEKATGRASEASEKASSTEQAIDITPEELTESAAQDRWAELGEHLRTGVEQGESDRPPDLESASENVEDLLERKRFQTDETSSVADISRGGSGEEFPGLSESRKENLDRVRNAESVLLVGPAGHPLADGICSRFLVGEQGPRDVIFVTFDDSSGDRIDTCHRTEGWTGGNIGIINAGTRGQKASTASEITGKDALGAIAVRNVSNPSNLSKLGIVITKLLAEFEKPTRKTVLCFYPLSELHNQVGTKTLFRFLNTLQGRLRTEDAVGLFHLDPELHDDIVIETLRPIFGTIIRYSADGELVIE